MAEVTCARCTNTREGLPRKPFPNEVGERLFGAACHECWQEWLKHQTALINHYALNLLDPKAKEYLYGQVEAFFFGETPDTPPPPV